MDLLHKDAWRDLATYKELYEYSIEHPVEYWAAQADRLAWIKRPEIIYDGKAWFADGIVNACYNCVDRHAIATPDKDAMIWQSGSDIGVSEKFTFKELLREVSRFANVLRMTGLTRNDYVTVHMPMVPEAIFACLACARLGIPYTVVYTGFSPHSVALRMNNCNSSFVITCDANRRGEKLISLKEGLDNLREIVTDRKIRALIIKKQGIETTWDDSLDIDYYELAAGVSTECPITPVMSNDDLFILYTSGSTGQPKGILHGTGGLLLFSSLTHRYFFNIRDDSVFWCSGDIGWMGGQAYSLIAPLCNGTTTVIYEGIPTYPSPSMFPMIIDKHKISSFNTAPTAIRAMMSYPKEKVFEGTSMDSLMNIGVFGEVINKDAWEWYFEEFGKGRCPIVNMWGQTEIGGVNISPLCNMDDMKTYGHVGRPFFGNKIFIDSEAVGPNEQGAMFMEISSPGMLKGVFGEADMNQYYSKIEGMYWAGDEAYYDDKGFFWITGRIDDVLNVSGHRVSPLEIENVLISDEAVLEASIVGYPHAIKGEGIYAFVVLKKGNISEAEKQEIRKRLIDKVKTIISPITKPDIVTFVKDLPKTRSGKIMKRILRKVAAEIFDNIGDITALQNPECIPWLIEGVTGVRALDEPELKIA
ncbi:MAG: acetate--CoA ligase [Holosporales bacterium]|jgi:acetyl-CoA synthetase|nr:acetate--CoA ligase [Holosporales bacterium]